MSYYDILQIEKDAKEEDIKKAYRQKALEYHPDRTSYDIEEAREKFRELDEAYKVLSNDDRRSLYDVYHRHKGIFEKNQQIGTRMQNQLRQMFMEYEQQYQKNSFLDDTILDQIPMINLDLLIKIYNTRHQKHDYYNYYKQLSHKIMQEIENSLKGETQIPTSPVQKMLKTNQYQYPHFGAKPQLKPNQNYYPPKSNSDSSDSNSEPLLNKRGYSYNEDSTNSMNQSNTRNQYSFKGLDNPLSINEIPNYQQNQGYSTNSSNQTYQNKTQEQIEDELMNEDDNGDQLFDQEDMDKYPNDLYEDDIQKKQYSNEESNSDRQINQQNFESSKKLDQLLDNPINYLIQGQKNDQNHVSPQLQNFYQQYLYLINNYAQNSQGKNNYQNTNKQTTHNGGQLNDQHQDDRDILSLYRNRVYSNDSTKKQLHSIQDKENQVELSGQQYNQRYSQQQLQQQQQQKLTKKQIKTLWQQTQQKKVIQKISQKQPIFKLIKKQDIKRPPIKWQLLQDKIQQVHQQIQQYTQFIMKYKNKKHQPSIMEISKQKYLELCERKKRFLQEQNILQQNDELDDYDATLDEKELACQLYCQEFNQFNQKNQQQHPKNQQTIDPQQIQTGTTDQQQEQQKYFDQSNLNNQQPYSSSIKQNQQEFMNEEDLYQRVNDYNNEKYLNDEEKRMLIDTNQSDGTEYYDNEQNQEESEIFNFNESQGYSSNSQNFNMIDYLNQNKEDADRVMQLIIDQQGNQPIQQSFTNSTEKVQNNIDQLNQKQNQYNMASDTQNVIFNDNSLNPKQGTTLQQINPQQNQNQNEIDTSFQANPFDGEEQYNFNENYQKMNNNCNEIGADDDFSYNANPNYLYQEQSSFNGGNHMMETPIKKNYFDNQQTPLSNMCQQFNNNPYNDSSQIKNNNQIHNILQENEAQEIAFNQNKIEDNSYQYLEPEDEFNNQYNYQYEFYDQN